MLRLGQGLVASRPVFGFQNNHVAGCVALAVLLAGCGSEQSSIPNPEAAPAEAALGTAKTPAEQNAAGDEISAAEQAGKVAAGKYQRGMRLLQAVQAKRGTAPAP